MESMTAQDMFDNNPLHDYPLNSLRIYERLLKAPNEETKALIIAEAFKELELRYPNLANTATRQDLSQTEYQLKLEIEKTHVKIEQIRADLTKEIEKNNTKIEEVRADLTK